MFWQKLSSFHLYRWAKGKELCILGPSNFLKNERWANQIDSLQKKEKKKEKRTWEAPHLMNRRDVFLHDCANIIWSLKGPKAFIFLP
jgi:hypothetical protein